MFLVPEKESADLKLRGRELQSLVAILAKSCLL